MKLLATICIATYAAAFDLKQRTCALAQTRQATEDSETTTGDSEMVCDHFCFGTACGWDCKVDGEPVADCISGMSYSGEPCNDNCMANG